VRLLFRSHDGQTTRHGRPSKRSSRGPLDSPAVDYWDRECFVCCYPLLCALYSTVWTVSWLCVFYPSKRKTLVTSEVWNLECMQAAEQWVCRTASVRRVLGVLCNDVESGRSAVQREAA